jgi:hypothetical protein
MHARQAGLLGMLLMVLLAGACAAQRPHRDVGWKVALDATETPLRQALDDLFRQTDVQFAVEPDAADLPVTVRFRNVTLGSGARLVIAAGQEKEPRLTATRDGDVFIFRLRGTMPGSPPPRFVDTKAAWAREVDLDLQRVPLREAVKQVIAQGEVRCSAEQDVPVLPITLKVRGVPVLTALRMLASVAALREPQLAFTHAGRAGVIHMDRPTPIPQRR